jgi:glycosyltransferase involved in cell wall biosynthesis
MQFVHGDAAASLGSGVETIWRFSPRLHFAVERLAVTRARQTVVMSRSGVQRLRAYSERVVLGANWFDSDHFYVDAADRPEPVTIGWAGRFEPQKDPLKAIEVFASLVARGVAFQAWMAGAGTVEASVQRAIREARLETRVELLGPLVPPVLGQRLRSASVFLLTSICEGIPRAAIEALACGVPVVSTDAGDTRMLISNRLNGFIAEEGAAAELADLVVEAELLERGAAIAASVAHLEVRQVVPKLLEQLAAEAQP